MVTSSHRFSTTSGVRQRCVLAPALFLVAIDWILGRLAPEVGITVGHYHFTDLAYADDAAILMSDQLQADSVLQSFNAFAVPLGLKLSWLKTKLQNMGAGDQRLSPFGYDAVPAHDALCLMVDTYKGRKPIASWRRPPGGPHNVWLNRARRMPPPYRYLRC